MTFWPSLAECKSGAIHRVIAIAINVGPPRCELFRQHLAHCDAHWLSSQLCVKSQQATNRRQNINVPCIMMQMHWACNRHRHRWHCNIYATNTISRVEQSVFRSRQKSEILKFKQNRFRTMDHARDPRNEIQTKSLDHKPPALTWKGFETYDAPCG